MREMNKEVTGSHFVEISGAGHISNMEEPDVFNLAVSDFLNLP
jgi:pimeloyl-ACP methyl ester carboxylesterase